MEGRSEVGGDGDMIAVEMDKVFRPCREGRFNQARVLSLSIPMASNASHSMPLSFPSVPLIVCSLPPHKSNGAVRYFPQTGLADTCSKATSPTVLSRCHMTPCAGSVQLLATSEAAASVSRGLFHGVAEGC